MAVERVYKNAARNLYNQGTVIFMVPCLLRPNGPWGFTFTMDLNERKKNYKSTDFDEIVSEFEIHNCGYETGYYAAFYKEA